MGEPDNKEADAGRKIIFSYGFVRDSDMDTKGVFLEISSTVTKNNLSCK